MDETRISGDLPNLRIEVVRRASEDGAAEMLSLNLTATPDLRSALPLAFTAWQGLAQAMLSPWMALAQANPFLRLPGPDEK